MSDVGNSSSAPSGNRGLDQAFSWQPRSVVFGTLTVLLVGLAFGILLRFYAVIFILFVGIVLSIATAPLTEWLHRHRLPLSVAVIAVYVLMLLVFIGFFFLVAPLLYEQVTTIAGNIPHYYQMLRDSMFGSSIILIHELAMRTPAQLSLRPESANGVVPGQGLDLTQLMNNISSALFVVVSVLVLAYYWTLNGERTLRALLLRVPMESRENLRQIISTMEGKVGAFLRGQAVLCLSVSGAMLTALLIIQLPYALSLALLAGVFEAVPILGPTLGAIPALLVALATAPDKVIWVLVAVIIIQQLESNVLIPRVMDKSVGVNPVVTILSIIAFGLLLGLPGTLLAIPLAAIIQVVVSYVVFEPPEPLPKEEGRGRASVLRYEAQQLRQDVRKQLRQKDEVVDGQADRIEDLIESIVSDVDSLLEDHNNVETEEQNL